MSTRSCPAEEAPTRNNNMNKQTRKRGFTWDCFSSVLTSMNDGNMLHSDLTTKRGHQPSSTSDMATVPETGVPSYRRQDGVDGNIGNGGIADQDCYAATTDYSLFPNTSSPPPSSSEWSHKKEKPEEFLCTESWSGNNTINTSNRDGVCISLPTPSNQPPSDSTAASVQSVLDDVVIRSNRISSSGQDHAEQPMLPKSIVVTSASTTTTRRQEFFAECKELLMDLIEYGKAKTWKKKLMAVALCLSSLLVFYDLLFGGYIVQWLRAFILWMAEHSMGAVFAFIGIFVISTLIFIPPTLLVFGAGYAFTLALGSTFVGALAALFCCFLGSCIGAIIAFLRSRYMMRDLIYVFCRRYPLVRAADRALKEKGFHIMLLLRLCPLIPFNGLNYCCGITGVSLHDFTTSLIGILPFHIYTIMLGATAGVLEQNLHNSDPSERQRYGFIGLIVSGVVFALIAMFYAWRVVKRELMQELELTAEEFDSLMHPSSAMSSASSVATVQDGRYVSGGRSSMASADYMNGIERGGIEITTSAIADHDNCIDSQYQKQRNQEHFSLTDEGEEWYWIWT